MNDVKFSVLDNIFIRLFMRPCGFSCGHAAFHAAGKNIFTIFYTIKWLTAGDEIAIL